MRNLVFAALLVVIVIGCAPPAAQESSELGAAAEGWQTAFNAGDLDALVAMYTDDARVLPPNGEIGQGTEAVAASMGEFIDAGLGGELTTIEAVVAGDLGYRVGTFTLHTEDGTTVDQGKFIELWRKVGGEWKITADMWSSNLPAAAQPSGTTLVISHEVKDPAHWLAAWQGEDSRHALFAQHGAASVRTIQSPDDPNYAGLVVEVTDMEAFQAFMSTPEVETAKDEDGLVDGTMRVYQVVE